MVKVLVLGDVMLDRDAFYQGVRKSGEGVPVIRLHHEEERLGGAGAVARMAQALGADVCLIGLIGERDEAAARRVIALTMESRLRHHFLVSDRPQTIKRRIVIAGEQLFREDVEDCQPINAEEVDDVAKALRVAGPFDVTLVSDYGKGMITPDLMRLLSGRIIVDPIAGDTWWKYPGACCLTPNRAELGDRDPREEMSLWGYECLVMKRDSEGMSILLHPKAEPRRIPPAIEAADLVDVCGAGDMVLAALGVAIAEGQSWIAAAEFANRAAGAKCRQVGAVPVSREEIDALGRTADRRETVGR